MNPTKAPEEPTWVGWMTGLLIVVVMFACGMAMRATYEDNRRDCVQAGGTWEGSFWSRDPKCLP